MKYFFVFFAFLFLNFACYDKQQRAIDEIKATELAFEKMIEQKGLVAGFSYFAADSAVKSLGDTLIFGKKNITKFYANQPKNKIELKWDADFVCASKSGDLGYTYGKYNLSITDSLGNKLNSKGIFHTVWQKQSDGLWKFVWD